MAKFTAASGSLYLNLYIDTSGQPNVEANTSNVAWRVTVSRTGAYYTYNEGGGSTLTVDVNGSRVNTSNPSWHTSGEEFTLASGTTTVGHNADGTKTVSASASFDPANGVHAAVSVSGSLALPTMPRASSVSIGTTTIGSDVTLTVTRASSSFTHTLRYEWGSTSGTIATGVGTSASWTPPLSLCYYIPSSTSSNGTIHVDTYSGSTKIGTKSIPFTASVPSSVKPTFTSATLTDLTPSTAALITGNNFVEVLSDIKVTWNGATGSYGSTITGYKAEIVNKNVTVNTYGGSFGPLNFDGSYTIRTSVLDSRGRWSDTKDYAIVLLNYHAPGLSFTVKRAGANMDKIVVVRNAIVAPLTVGTTQMNTMTLAYSVAPLGSTTFTADTGGGGTWSTLSTLTNSEAPLNGTYAPNKSWVVRGILSDNFLSTPSTFEAIVSVEGAIYYYDKDGRFGVGKVVNPSIPAGSLDVAGSIYAGGKLLRDIFYPIGAIYQSTVITNPSYFIGGTWERFGNGRVLVGVDEADSDFSTSNKTGGAKTHTLTVAEMPSHTHTFSGADPKNYVKVEASSTTGLNASAKTTEATGGGQAHNNLQPYITVYTWRRTA